MIYENTISDSLKHLFAEKFGVTDITFDDNAFMTRKGCYLDLNRAGNKLAYIPVRNLSRFRFTDASMTFSCLDVWCPEKRFRFAVQSSVRKCLNACGLVLPDHIIQNIEFHFNAPLLTFSELSEGISEIYHQYSGRYSGSLENSCMQGRPKEFFECYDKEPNCQLIVAHDLQGNPVGRALLWLSDEGYRLCDRRYANDSYIERAIIEYAYDKGYYVRDFSSHNIQWLDKQGDILTNQTVTLSNPIHTYRYYPYMDTFKYGKKMQLSSCEYRAGQILTDTDGKCDFNRAYCNKCSQKVLGFELKKGLCKHCSSEYEFICQGCQQPTALYHGIRVTHLKEGEQILCQTCLERTHADSYVCEIYASSTPIKPPEKLNISTYEDCHNETA